MSTRRTLGSLAVGESGRIASLEGDPQAVQRLMDMGMIRGTRVELVRRAPLGDPLEVRLRGFMLTLRRAEAELITVE